MAAIQNRKIAYYISAHGYGHAARSVPVLSELVLNHKVTIKTEIPAAFFRTYLDPSYQFIPQTLDVGCIQKDFINIDIEQTFLKFGEFNRNRAQRLASEAQWLEQNEIDLVISDIPSYPLKAAHSLGVPSILISNFTWYDIYGGFPSAAKEDPILQTLKDEYSSATLQILPQCHIPSTLVANRMEVGVIALKGRDVRVQIENHLNLSCKGKTLVFIYLGQYGSLGVLWENLERLEHYIFITRDPLPSPSPSKNLFVLDDRFTYPDLVASSDLVCTKGGYSTLATAWAHGKPVISSDRHDFVEFDIIKDFLLHHQIGIILNMDKFNSCDWAETLKKAAQLTVKGKVSVDGEREVICQVEKFLAG